MTIVTGCLTLVVGFSLIGPQHGIADSPASVPQTHGTDEIHDPPTATQLRRITKRLLKAEAVAETGTDRQAATGKLCDLYVVFRTHPRYADHVMLKQDAVKVRNRLLSIAKETKSRLRREGVDRPDELDQRVTQAIREAVQDAQQPPSHSRSPWGGSLTKKPSSSQNKRSGRVASAGAGGAEPGWELVELIQQLVRPDFWDANGGPGSVRYFALRRVLVISATTDVHEDIADLLGVR